jgi:hypothetical protein
MAVCRHRNRREDILDKAQWIGRIQRAPITALLGRAVVRGRRLGDRVADGRPVARRENESRIAPCCAAVARLAVDGDGKGPRRNRPAAIQRDNFYFRLQSRA